MKKYTSLVTFVILSIFTVLTSTGQDIEYARSIIDTLAAPGMHGRGYYKSGDRIAAEFLGEEFGRIGAQYFEESYFQNYSLKINYLTGNPSFSIDGKQMQPGSQYLVYPSTPTVKGEYEVIKVSARVLKKEKRMARFARKKGVANKVAFIPEPNRLLKSKLYRSNPLGVKGYILGSSKPSSFACGRTPSSCFTCLVHQDHLPTKIEKVNVDFKSKYEAKYQTQNVIAYVKGREHPEKFIVFTAHYDHLGRLSNNAYFPGANDNGSGTAMIIDLAAYYADENNLPDCSVAFMLFSGEESGLNGSFYYVENPLFPLEQIQFVINLDMVGTGSEGIQIVNSTEHPEAFNLLDTLNTQFSYLKQVKKRGPSANSDHYPFVSKKVPAFFIYTLGKEHMEYHTVNDKAEALPLTEYEDLFRLLTKFVEEYPKVK